MNNGKVLILGAGASLGHGVIDVPKPPSVSSFFKYISQRPFSKDYASLINYCESHLGISPDALLSTDLENLAANLEPMWQMKLVPDNPVMMANQYGEEFIWASAPKILKSLIIDVIWSSTSWLHTHTCPFHDALVNRWLEKGDVVISFNYDLIMDTSLLKSKANWSESTGYGWLCVMDKLDVDYSNINDIDLLKPHGSLNWTLEKDIELSKSSETYRIRVSEIKELLNTISVLGLPRLAPRLVKLWNSSEIKYSSSDPSDQLQVALMRST